MAAAAIPSLHRRYVGRPDNSKILKDGYNALQTPLSLTGAQSFRESICSNLTQGVLKAGPTGAKIESIGAGFRVTFQGGSSPSEFAFDYSDNLRSKDANFMQAIAQFLIMTFIQMFIDYRVPNANAAVVLEQCTASLKIANDIVNNLQSDQPNITSVEQKQLLVEIASVLNTISKHNHAIEVTDEGDLTISLLSTSVTVLTSRVTNLYDLMVYNANTAATLLLAAKEIEQKHETRVPALLKKLCTVVHGYTTVMSSAPTLTGGVNIGLNVVYT